MKLIVAGGITSKFATIKAKFGHKYNTNFASIDELDFESGQIKSLLRFVPPAELRSEELGKDVRFTSCTIKGDRFYACSPTQVFVYSYPSFELIREVNHPHFNDVHHVNVINGELVVANTGLDAAMIFDMDGNFKSILSSNGNEVWDKFDQAVDYRKIASTKPHVNHPNYAFEINGEIWLTRFHDMDAVCLSDKNKRIDIAAGKPHDGHLIGDFVYFTTINGFIVIANKHTLKVEERINLNDIDDRDTPLGWCRSFALDGDHCYVGFTRLRRTKIESNLRWVKAKFTNVKDPLPARIAKYDLVNKKLLGEFVSPEGYTDLIFSIIPKPN